MKHFAGVLYLSVLEKYYVHGQIPQDRMWVIKVPAVVHVPPLVLSYDASAKSRNAQSLFASMTRSACVIQHTPLA